MEAMELTQDYIRLAFEKYNRLIFDDRLPLPVLKLSKARTRLGQMSCKRGFLKRRPYDFMISISSYFKQSQQEIDDVIIHEMIHYYIAYNEIKDTSAHGKVFRSMMAEINRRYGRHLTISVKTKGMEPTIAKQPTTCLVLAIEIDNGTCYLSSVNPKFAHEIALTISRISSVTSHSWFTTQDAFFLNMPRVRSLRGRKVSRTFYQEMMGRMKPFEFPRI